MSDKRTDATSSLRAEYERRAKEVADAVARSEQMERDFLENKVLNRDANEACADSLHKRRAFAAWLMDNHAALYAPSEIEPPNVLEALRELSNMYSHAWDRIDGSLVMLPASIKRFEAAHAKADAAIEAAMKAKAK